MVCAHVVACRRRRRRTGTDRSGLRRDDPWPAVERWVAQHDSADVAERARLLGLPAAVLGETPAEPPRIYPFGAATKVRGPSGLLVADLSAMWAGPLCGQLLAQAGVTVVKVESTSRPDGARAGSPDFFDWMNGGKLSYVVDFDQPSEIYRLLSAADIVIESSRPAALIRRGLGRQTSYLRATAESGCGSPATAPDGEHANWVAFGDDAAVSGGLVCGGDDAPVFCGDAIADPLTGLEAAVAVAQSLCRGGGELIEFSMSAVAATYAELPNAGETHCNATPWLSAKASELGADNDVVEQLITEKLSLSC